jgi:shikimate kinase
MLLSLIGYRATGKTTLAQLLAARLDCPWIDADTEIERRAGKSIARIFAEDGQPAFRDIEAAAIADLCRRGPLVLAAGGGAPLRAESRRAMRAAGKVVWLTARPETVLTRMAADATTAARRPNLTAQDPLAEIIELLAQREPIYRESAHLVIETDEKSPAQLVEEILARLGLQKSPPPSGRGPG